jgi:hypothetical protein
MSSFNLIKNVLGYIPKVVPKALGFLGKKATANPSGSNWTVLLAGAAGAYFNISGPQVSEVLRTLATFFDKVPA